jgi:hypothetical protein
LTKKKQFQDPFFVEGKGERALDKTKIKSVEQNNETSFPLSLKGHVQAKPNLIFVRFFESSRERKGSLTSRVFCNYREYK